MTRPPLPGSPAIDTGSDSVTNSLPADQRGLPRKVGAHVDIGAVESGSAIPGYNYAVVTTTNDVLSDGLALHSSRVLGQVLPGCSVVRCPDDHPRYPGLPVVIFPGNVGDDDALAEVFRRMAQPRSVDPSGA